MNYKNCPIYGLKSKKKLLELMQIKSLRYCTDSYIAENTKPRIINRKRLIEPTSFYIKQKQYFILRQLKKISTSKCVYSGVKGKSYIDNAKEHQGNKNIFKLDIAKFFPNISRDKVYRFYKYKLNMSSDVSKILTNFSTINLDLKDQSTSEMVEVNNFIYKEQIKERNHLFTGSPLSPLFSYFINIDMFHKLEKIAQDNSLIITIYIDDIVFSGNCKISNALRKKIKSIITNENYLIKKTKCEKASINRVVKVTGVILDKQRKLQILNKLIYKTHQQIEDIKNNKYDCINELMGRVIACNSINGKLKEFKGVLKSIKKEKNNQ